MQAFAFVLTCLLTLGCSQEQSHSLGKSNLREQALEVWQSATATPEQRLEAVRKLMPVGTSIKAVQRLLGEGEFNRFHGPYIGYVGHFTNSIPNPTTDANWLQYKFPQGDVMLVFNETSIDGHVSLWFASAYCATRVANYPTITNGRPLK